MDKEVIALAGMTLTFGIPLLAIWTHHVRKLAEIKARGVENKDSALRNEVAALRAEVEALRDTTTKFDLSFDSQLTQLETRMERAESKSVDMSRYQTEETPQNQLIGR
ncbi:MAG: hypothetical protein QM758_29465 [Armatimonas sp.]